jgi:hypothetical protein
MNTTHATAAAAGGASAAAVVLLTWGMKQFLGIELPDDVAVSTVALLAPVIHYVTTRFFGVAPTA